MKETILMVLKEALPSVDFESSNSLVDDGILDSLSIVTAVTAISSAFDINFEIDEITPENFNSIEAIIKTVLKHKS